jgi:CTP-dependent riboflavin kinase
MIKEMTLTGKIVSGVKQGAFFTQLDWFQSQCRDKLGFEPYPGTLNLEISIDDVPIIETLEAFPVVVEGIRAAVVIPAEEVRVHGKNIIEVISDQRLKDVLKVDEGDFVILSIGARDTPN